MVLSNIGIREIHMTMAHNNIVSLMLKVDLHQSHRPSILRSKMPLTFALEFGPTFED